MATRRLVLIRHAKAVRHGVADIERPLAERGLVDAAAIGRWLAERDLVPDRVVVSPAVRARQTWELAADSAGATAAPIEDDRVYDNTVEALLEIAGEPPPEVSTLALVGHNPSIEDLAFLLDDTTGNPSARAELHTKYPTSGVAVFDVRGPWAGLTGSAATLIAFAVPRG